MPDAVVIIGIFYGVITGILLAMLILAGIVSKHNLASSSKKQDLPYHSTRGVEVFSNNMTDSFFSAPTLGKVKGAKKVDRAAKEKQDRLDYFTRNLI